MLRSGRDKRREWMGDNRGAGYMIQNTLGYVAKHSTWVYILRIAMTTSGKIIVEMRWLETENRGGYGHKNKNRKRITRRPIRKSSRACCIIPFFKKMAKEVQPGPSVL